MSEETSDAKPPIPLDEVARIVNELAAQSQLSGVLARFLELVRTWAAPSAILAAVEDKRAETGWRLIPSLCVGSGPLGVERSLAQVVSESPEGRKRPIVVQKADEVPGVRVRENWIIPWWHEAQSGVLLVRGVPKGYAPNVLDALVVVAAPVWGRLLGSPAERVEELARDVQVAASRLQDEMTRQVERLHAAAQPPPSELAERAAQVAELEAQLAALKEQLATGVKAFESGQAKVAALEAAVRAAETQRDDAKKPLEEAKAAAEAAQQKVQQAEGERDKARSEGQEARAEVERLSARVKALEEQGKGQPSADETRRASEAAQQKIQQAEGERDKARAEGQEARAEVERLSTRIQALLSEQASTTQRLDDAARNAQTASQKLKAAEEQRDEASAEADRLSARVKALLAEQAGGNERLEELRKTADAAIQKARTLEQQSEQARMEMERLATRTMPIPVPSPAETGQLDQLKRAAETAQEAAKKAEEALAAAQKELQEKSAAQQAKAAQFEEARTEIEQLKNALNGVRAEAEPVRAELEKAKAALEKAQAEAQARAAEPAPTKAEAPASLDVLRQALVAMRRVPFLPGRLRASLEEAAKSAAPNGEKAPWLSVALLDRDPAGTEPLVAELEEAGLRVWLAHHPEELAILVRNEDLKPPIVAVCDVMAFRPDQNVAGLFRGWEKDKPGLQFYLSFNQSTAAEAERARRVPMSLLAGHLQRPIRGTGLIAALQILSSQKQA